MSNPIQCLSCIAYQLYYNSSNILFILLLRNQEKFLVALQVFLNFYMVYSAMSWCKLQVSRQSIFPVIFSSRSFKFPPRNGTVQMVSKQCVLDVMHPNGCFLHVFKETLYRVVMLCIAALSGSSASSHQRKDGINEKSIKWVKVTPT